jgi:mRNA interferase RelE/StbE
MKRITYSKQAIKTLARIDRKTQMRLRARIEMLAADASDPRLDIKSLAGHAGSFRLRVGGWRVIYSATGLVLLIEKIGARGDVYN